MPRNIPRVRKQPLNRIRSGLRNPSTAKKYFNDRLSKRRGELSRTARKIGGSPHRSILIPYVTRILAAETQGERLTSLQKSIARTIAKHVSAERVINRFQDLPPAVGQAMDRRVFSLQRSSDVDNYVRTQLAQSAQSVERAVQASRSDVYRMESFRDVTIEGIGALKDWSQSHTTPREPDECPPIYQLRLEYRGITTHRTADRSGGVEPYLITGMYRIPFRVITGAVHPISESMKVAQYPKNLGNMSVSQWMPSGGKSDAAGNPSNPIQFFPVVTSTRVVEVPGHGELTIPVSGAVTPLDWSPVLLGRDLHCALISVWEQDGDQSAELMRNMGSAMTAMGALLSSTGVGAVLVVIGAALELASYLTGEDDDPIGDRVLLFGEEHLQAAGYTERKFTVSKGDNRWTIYIGAECQKVEH